MKPLSELERRLLLSIFLVKTGGALDIKSAMRRARGGSVRGYANRVARALGLSLRWLP